MNVRLAAFAMSLAALSPGLAEQRLVWGNGDSLLGEVGALEGDTLNWECPLFGDRVPVAVSALRSIVFPTAERLVEIDEPFRAEMATGDVLFGKLNAIDEASVTLESARHGEVELKRSELVSLRRVDGTASLVLGGLAGWGTLTPGRKASAWRGESRGRVVTELPNAELFRKLELPARAEIELALTWQGRPGFVFSVTRDDDPMGPESVGIESWDDELVLVQGSKFERVTRLSRDSGSVHLRLYLDREAGQVTVCSHEGTELAQLSGVVLGGGGERGLYLRSKRGKMALEMLRVGRWSGRLPSPLKAGENRLHFVNGEVLGGSVTSFDAVKGSVAVRAGNEIKSIPIDDLEVLYFEAKPRPPAGGAVEISYHDGALLRGKLEALSGGAARLRTPFSADPVECSLESCRELAWASPKQDAPSGGDVLYWEGGRSHGAIAGSKDGEFALAWKPVGGKAAISLRPSESLRILRRGADSGNAGGEGFPDSIHLTDLTALPCRLEKVDEGGAVVTTPFNKEPVQVENSLMKVVEFQHEGGLEGFGDARWRRSGADEALKLTPGRAEFVKGGGLGHPAAMAGSSLRFKLEWAARSRAQVELRMFADSVADAGGEAVRLLVGMSYNSLTVTSPGGSTLRAASVSSPRAQFDITCQRDLLVVRVNGDEVLREELEGGRPGRGVQFAVNSVSVIGGRGEGMVRVSEFSTRATGDTALYIQESVREKVFTVPRLRKSNPPTHAVVAPNGDVLRGELLSADRETVRFRSKLREFPIPRARTAGIIWFHDKSGGSSRSGAARLMLGGDRMIAVDPESLDGGTLVGKSSVFGEIRVPLGKVREIHLGDYRPDERISPYADWELRPAKEPEPVGG